MHKTKFVTVGERSADIDIKIVPLIRLLWQLDIDTILSCQSNCGMVWVMFPTPIEATRFFNIVAVYEPGRDALYNRIVNEYTTSRKFRNKVWSVNAHVEDFALNYDTDCADDEYRHDGLADIYFGISVRFPPSDLPAVLKRLRDYKNGKTITTDDVEAELAKKPKNRNQQTLDEYYRLRRERDAGLTGVEFRVLREKR